MHVSVVWHVDSPSVYPAAVSVDDIAAHAGGKNQIDTDEATRNRLADIMSLHVLPPVANLNAVWTSPFFTEGTTLSTLKSGTQIRVSSNNGGNAVLEAPSSSATVQQKDIYACKVGIGRAHVALLMQHIFGLLGAALCSGWPYLDTREAAMSPQLLRLLVWLLVNTVLPGRYARCCAQLQPADGQPMMFWEF